MAEYLTKSKQYLLVKGGITKANMHATYGPWATKEAAWAFIAEGETTADFLEPGMVFAVKTDTSFTEYKLDSVLTSTKTSYTIDDFKEVKAGDCNLQKTTEGGYKTSEATSAGQYGFATGNQTKATGSNSFTCGYGTEASANSAHAEGNSSKASSASAHAEGDYTVASGASSHAEGSNTTASSNYAHAEGYKTTADGADAHAEGNETEAYGPASHTEGSNTKTLTTGGHAEGGFTIAQTQYAHAEGYYTLTTNNNEHAEGMYNKSVGKTSSTPGTLSSVGFGTSTTDRKNAHEVNTNGDNFIYGVGGYNGTNMTSAHSVAKAINYEFLTSIPTADSVKGPKMVTLSDAQTNVNISGLVDLPYEVIINFTTDATTACTITTDTSKQKVVGEVDLSTNADYTIVVFNNMFSCSARTTYTS